MCWQRRSVGPQCLFALGNLHMFLPAEVVTAIQPEAWKLFVEASAGRRHSLAVCGNSEQRDAWHRITVRAFGSVQFIPCSLFLGLWPWRLSLRDRAPAPCPDCRPAASWGAGTLAAIGDTLAALPPDAIAAVRMVSWRDAADTLAERTIYHLHAEAPGSDHPLAFIEVTRVVIGDET